MRFEKWQALGNDYVIIEAEELPWDLTPERIRVLCAPHTGIGSDGILLLSRTNTAGSVAHLRIFNPDGSEAELSGNGAREAILYLRAHGWTDQDQFSIDTAAGEIRPTITGPDSCRVDMGRAHTTSKDFPSGGVDGRGRVESAGRSWEFQHAQVGNPQAAILVPDLDTLLGLDLPTIGPDIEHAAIFPQRTNVSFYTPLAAPAGGEGSRIRARIFERGVGETAASGTGATGAAVAHVLRGGDSPVTVVLDGGELVVEVEEDLHITLSGWARPVFAATLSPELTEELHATV
ncbi:MAG TPA: diaminopimelate epimerase [Solirubrobacteraceae bacterium]|nr:diaminopimelate epimerase [Solirubrobacteraceae bacterium]